MPQPTEYRGSLTREQFLFFETRTVAKLILEGLSEDEAIEKSISDNLLQFPTEKNVRSVTQGCYRRLVACDNSALIELVANAPVEVSKQAALYALMTYNAVVWDFMVDIIAEKYRTQDFSFSRKDVILFLDNLREREPQAARWSDATINKIRQVLTKALQEVGFIDSIKSTTLNTIYLYDEVKSVIEENGDREVLAAFNCFY